MLNCQSLRHQTLGISLLLINIPQALSANTATTTPTSLASGLPMLIILVGFFYLMIIRPQTLKQKQHQKQLNQLALGDEIVTTGGILGTIEKLTDDFIHINVANDVSLVIKRQHVSQALPKGTRQHN